MKILVVDDEKTLVKGIKFNLENEGYQVECAYDGAAAVVLMSESKAKELGVTPMATWVCGALGETDAKQLSELMCKAAYIVSNLKEEP